MKGTLSLLIALSTGSFVLAGDKREVGVSSGYHYQPIKLVDGHGARRLYLQVQLDGKSGSGTLSLDPNLERYTAFGDDDGNTEMAIKEIKVQLVQVEKDDPTKKGRLLYEVKYEKLLHRLYLVVPPTKSESPLLLLGHKTGEIFLVIPSIVKSGR
jgi:hypothetical protein